MNYYVVVEGITEGPLYKCWIPFVNPNLKFVAEIEAINENNFYIISGNGYPYYFNVIEDSIEEVNSIGNIDKLVIAIDSEEMSHDEKYTEISEFISDKACIAQVSIIVQHFCVETWGLGNKRINKKNPTDLDLLKYKSIYDVYKDDPELLPGYPEIGLNRAQFAFKYLKAILKNRFRKLVYTKRNPTPLLHLKYFEEVVLRYKKNNHIPSFARFMEVFRDE